MQGWGGGAVSKVLPDGEDPANDSICPRVTGGLAEHLGRWMDRQNQGEQ